MISRRNLLSGVCALPLSVDRPVEPAKTFTTTHGPAEPFVGLSPVWTRHGDRLFTASGEWIILWGSVSVDRRIAP